MHFHNKIISRWMQSRESCIFSHWKSCLFGYSPIAQLKWVCKWCFVDLKLVWTFLLDEFWISGLFIFLSTVIWRKLDGLRYSPYACKACQVSLTGLSDPSNQLTAWWGAWCACSALTLILAGKWLKVLRFVHTLVSPPPHLLHSLPIILLPTDDT